MESVRNANTFETADQHREDADGNPGGRPAKGMVRGGRPPKRNKMALDGQGTDEGKEGLHSALEEDEGR
jgi:hypothetical protein